MTKTLVLIDRNLTVQAITALALRDTGIEVHTSADAESLEQSLNSLSPDIILCGADCEFVDPFMLCRSMRSNEARAKVPFVLLVPTDQVAKYQDRADHAGISKILERPFRSDRLRQLVLDLLSPPAVVTLTQEFASEEPKADPEPELEPEPESKLEQEPEPEAAFEPEAEPESQPGPGHAKENSAVLLYIENALVRGMLEKTLSKWGTECCSVSSWEEAKEKLVTESHGILIANFSGGHTLPDNTTARVILIASEEFDKKSLLALCPEEVLYRPLSYEKVFEVFQRVFGAPPEITNSALPLEAGEQALLAGKISASIFECLLTQESLRHRNWEEVCNMASEQALRICKEFEQGSQ